MDPPTTPSGPGRHEPRPTSSHGPTLHPPASPNRPHPPWLLRKHEPSDGAATSDHEASVFGESKLSHPCHIQQTNKQRRRRQHHNNDHHRHHHRHLASHKQLPRLVMKPHLLAIARGSIQGARNEETPLIQRADVKFFSAALGSASAAAELAPAGLVLAFGQIEKTLDPGGFFAALAGRVVELLAVPRSSAGCVSAWAP